MDTNNKTLIDEINKSYSSLIENYFPKELLEKAKTKKIKILSVGCGKFREAKNLFEYFSSHEKNLKLCGIEIDENLINSAKDDEFIKSKTEQISFKCADASNIENYKEWISDGLFDLIIVRHPEITFNTEIFMRIFSICGELLLDGGKIFITNHFENEKESLKLLFKLINYKIVIEEENEKSPSIEIDGKKQYSDKFLLIVSKN